MQICVQRADLRQVLSVLEREIEDEEIIYQRPSAKLG